MRHPLLQLVDLLVVLFSAWEVVAGRRDSDTIFGLIGWTRPATGEQVVPMTEVPPRGTCRVRPGAELGESAAIFLAIDPAREGEAGSLAWACLGAGVW